MPIPTSVTVSLTPVSEVIVSDPEILSGMPVFGGTRVPFKNLLDYLEGGHTIDEFLDDFPSVTRVAAIAALEHASAGQAWPGYAPTDGAPGRSAFP
jgi:uncharacterized protein (DUF433 family)